MEEWYHQLKTLGATFKNKELILCMNKLKANLIKELQMIYRFLQMKENWINAWSFILKTHLMSCKIVSRVILILLENSQAIYNNF
jgi:hypothetical protein